MWSHYLRDELVCHHFPSERWWCNVDENREPGCRGWFESSDDEPHCRVVSIVRVLDSTPNLGSY